MINIEGNLNFYDELKKQLNNNVQDNDVEDNDEPQYNLVEDNIKDGNCLITNEKLKKGYVTLSCNHSFNYIPLYNDLVYHKKSLNLETQYLKTNEIRCPYCRNKQVGLIPYYNMDGVKKIIGVNYIKQPNTIVGKCNFDEFKKEYLLKDCELVKQKLNNEPDNALCPNIVSVLSEDKKCYCNKHKNKVKNLINSYNKYKSKKENKESELELLNDKLNEKINMLNEKLKQLNQLNISDETKIKLKSFTNTFKDKINKIITTNNENVVIDMNTVNNENVVINMNLCNVILVSGKNKGKQCSFKKYNSEKCKRHYNLQLQSADKLNEILDEIDE